MFACLECGKRFKTARAAERAINDGCPGCGGVDIDVCRPAPDAPRGAPQLREIPYSREMTITNLGALPPGLNAPFLEVCASHIAGELIAVRWRRIRPDTLPAGRALIAF